MRCGIDALSGLVRNQLQQNPMSGDLFIFVNKPKTHLKLLHWQGDGFVGNKNNLIVLIPNPNRLIKDYIEVSKKFCHTVMRNPHFKDILKKHTTIIDEDLIEAPIQYISNTLTQKPK